MKHFYKEIKGWSDSIIPFYRRIVKELPNGSHIVELGVFQGRSLAFLVVEMMLKEKKFFIDGIDNFKIETDNIPPEVSKRKFLINMKPVKGKFSFIEKGAIEAASLYADKTLDVVYIDDFHTEPHIIKEIGVWLPKIKKGGIIAGHDYDKDSAAAIAVANYWKRKEIEIIKSKPGASADGGGWTWIKRI